jgi:hypothetical protein
MNYVPALIIGVLIGATALYLFLRRKPNREKQIIDDSPGRNANPAFAVDSVFDVEKKAVVLNQPGQNRFFIVQISKENLEAVLRDGAFKKFDFSFATDDARRTRNTYFKAFKNTTDTAAARDAAVVDDFVVLSQPYPRLFASVPAELGMLSLPRTLIDQMLLELKGKPYAALRITPTLNSPVNGEATMVDSNGDPTGSTYALNPCPPYKPDTYTRR